MHDAVYFLLTLNLLGKVAAWLLYARAPWLAVAAWVVTDVLLFYHWLVPGAQGLVCTYRSFRTTRREVWLTIDDGPDPEDTPRLLQLLREKGVRVTFFVIGEQVEKHPELIREIITQGHEIGHHTHMHPLATFWCSGPGTVRTEIVRPLDFFKRNGITPRWFRPPAGINNLWLNKELTRNQLRSVGWSVRGLEYSSRSVDTVVDRVMRGVKPGAIILLHEGPRVPASLRVAAVRGVIERLQADGYVCVIPELEQLRTRVA